MPFLTPTIRIRLTGLLAFYFTENADQITLCKIGILNGPADHKFRVNVYHSPVATAQPKKADLILELSEKVKDESMDLTITDPLPTVPGIIIASPTAPAPFNTFGGNELEFRLIPDMAGPDLHNTVLPHAFSSFITIDRGAVFYTRAVKQGWILREEFTETSVTTPGVARFKKEIGIEAGINIYLQDTATAPNSKAKLMFPGGELVMTHDPTKIFIIEMLNDCPLKIPTPLGFFESDFKLYYLKINAPTITRQFTVVFQDKGTGGGGPLNIDHPCGPIKGG